MLWWQDKEIGMVENVRLVRFTSRMFFSCILRDADTAHSRHIDHYLLLLYFVGAYTVFWAEYRHMSSYTLVSGGGLRRRVRCVNTQNISVSTR